MGLALMAPPVTQNPARAQMNPAMPASEAEIENCPKNIWPNRNPENETRRI